MKIGIPKEILNNENRIALTPSGVLTLANAGHQIFVETEAGLGSSFADKEYEDAGATIVSTAKEAWNQELILKVKEPQVEEYEYLREDLKIFTYLHLAAEEKLTKQLIDKKVTSLAYETVQLDDGSLPLLTPMSEVAGYMAAQIGAQFLEKPHGGKGVLLAGIPGVKRAKVTIIGGGVVGTNAAKIAVGLGASVSVIDLSSRRLKELDDLFGSKINTLISNPMNISEEVAQSDLVIGAVLIPGSKAPKLVTEEMVKNMSPGSVIVDVAIDQGGIFETSDRVTTHDHPIYKKYGISHYAVANMPGAVPRTSTTGLTNATVPYVLEIAGKGIKQALLDNEALRKGMNTYAGTVTNKNVADAHNLPYEHAMDILSRL